MGSGHDTGQVFKITPHGKMLVVVRIDGDVLNFYQKMARRNKIPYQTLINLTLKKFAAEGGELVIRP